MSDAVLALYLDGPMQSWGYESRLNRRTTLSYPTRSGVLGMLCAALGADRSDRKALDELANLRMEVYSFSAPSRWMDYHTVGGGYDSKAERQFMPRKANAATPQTVLTDREYLANAKFGVLLYGDAGLLARCEAALRDPVWGVWLGRKCCIPASPIGQGIFTNYEEALEHLKTLAPEEEMSGRIALRKVVEVDRFDEGNDTLMDRPVCFATREFLPRRVLNEPDPEDGNADI